MNERKFSLIQKEIDFLKEVKDPQTLFIGDSYFQLWYENSLGEFSFFHCFNKETSLNLGIGSTKFKDWLYLLDGLHEVPNFKQVVINLGFNDIHHTEETTYQDIYNDLISFLNKFKKLFPTTEIYITNIVISPLYENIRERIETYNSLVNENQKELGVSLIDIASKIDEKHRKENCFIEDGMHLTNVGYSVFVNEIKKALSKNTKARIFSIEEFSVYDGPGIRTTIFFKGCPLNCSWCHSPEGKSYNNISLRSPNGCLACGKCVEVCPNGRKECSACGKCVEVCPNSLIRLAAKDYDVEFLANELSKNIDILNMNKGGITFSGGEPLLQSKALLEIINLLKGKTHLALQTCGHANEKDFLEVINKVDLLLFDMKIINKEKALIYEGVDNSLIMKNLETLKKSNTPFIARIPLIPGVVDTEENILEIIHLIKDAHNLISAELLPYNKYAGSKYALLGINYEPKFDESVESNPRLELFGKYNIKARVL